MEWRKRSGLRAEGNTFIYTVTDACEASASGSVTVKVKNPAAEGPTFLGITADATSVTVRMEGFPEKAYPIEAASDLRDWVRIGQMTAGADGRFEVSDDRRRYASRYYRARL